MDGIVSLPSEKIRETSPLREKISFWSRNSSIAQTTANKGIEGQTTANPFKTNPG